MNKQVIKCFRLSIIGLVFLAVVGYVPSGSNALSIVNPAPSRAMTISEEELPSLSRSGDYRVRQDLQRSTKDLPRSIVQIIALEESDGWLYPISTGSGTILSPDGFILTNAHVATGPTGRPDALGVAVTVYSDTPPELKYFAEIQAIDYQLDLAVIQIVSDLNGWPVNTEHLNLSYVRVGDSDLLELGDALQILGYPGIGGETITLTRGVVSGFSREQGVEGRAYIKTDTTIAGGNSGGLAANTDGEIVGVPTQVGYGSAERFADCRYMADTNGDGVLNEDDNCIPVGGFINALRPVNLAKPLLEAVGIGIVSRSAPVPAGGLFIRGYILNAYTGRGIPGALYVVLVPGVTVDSWDGSEEQIYTWEETDYKGYFELPDSLERNKRYSIIVWAEDYEPAMGDNVLISDEPSPLEVEITLQRE